MIGRRSPPGLDHWKAAAQAIFAPSGGNKAGALYLTDAAAMFAAPDGAALAGSGVGTGLLMDASKGMVLGSNLVTNGSFASNVDGFVAGGEGSLTWDTGQAKLTITGSGGSINVSSPLSVSATKSYVISVDIKLGTYAGNINLVIGGGVIAVLSPTTQYATYRVVVHNPSNGSLYLSRASDATGTVYFDNISTSEIAGYHAIQATAANRPTRLVTPQTLRSIFVPSGTQALVATLPNLGLCTVVRFRVDGTVEYTEGVTVNGATTITETNSVFCGCLIASGTLDAQQKFVIAQLAGWYRPGTAAATVVANGGFDVDIASWVQASGPTHTWDAGRATGVASYGYAIFRQTVTVEAGVPYFFNYTVDKGTSVGVIAYIGISENDSSLYNKTITVTGAYIGAFIPTKTSSTIHFRVVDADAETSKTYYVDSVSVKKVI